MAGRTGRQMARWEIALVERLRHLPRARAPVALRRRVLVAIAALGRELDKANEHEIRDLPFDVSEHFEGGRLSEAQKPELARRRTR